MSVAWIESCRFVIQREPLHFSAWRLAPLVKREAQVKRKLFSFGLTVFGFTDTLEAL